MRFAAEKDAADWGRVAAATVTGCTVCSYNTCALGDLYATVFDTFNKTACQ